MRPKVAPSLGQGDTLCTSGDPKATSGPEPEFTCCAQDCPTRGRARSYQSGVEGELAHTIRSFEVH